ncbi:MAG: hypothetical protein ACRENU_05135, partial [Gemmatimonadaceae bacterium]
LFLGYSLDLWNYRLALRVFGRWRPRLKLGYAVREPRSQMETIYWTRLGCNMIPADPEQAADQLSQIAPSAPPASRAG